MSAFGKVIDSAVIVGSIGVGFTSVKSLMEGVKTRNNGVILVSSLTTLIAIYAFQQAIKKVNE